MKCRTDWIQNQFRIVGPAFDMGIAGFFHCVSKTKDFMMLQEKKIIFKPLQI